MIINNEIIKNYPAHPPSVIIIICRRYQSNLSVFYVARRDVLRGWIHGSEPDGPDVEVLRSEYIAKKAPATNISATQASSHKLLLS